MTKKRGYCQYQDCGIDLGMVHVATKYCRQHRILKIKQDQQAAHRHNYKSKYHRDHVIGGDYKDPKPIPRGLKEGLPCPGNGNGFCGAILRRERVMDAKGYTTPFFDYVCGTHRFPDPREDK